MKNEKKEQNSKQSAKKVSFMRPELKKHGKLKNTAKNSVNTYTYVAVT
jgi:hypothetical protein